MTSRLLRGSAEGPRGRYGWLRAEGNRAVFEMLLVFLFKKDNFIFFIFLCAGSSLLRGLLSCFGACFYLVVEHRLLGVWASVATARGLRSWGYWAWLPWGTRESSQIRDPTCVPGLGRWTLYHWATREVLQCLSKHPKVAVCGGKRC